MGPPRALVGPPWSLVGPPEALETLLVDFGGPSLVLGWPFPWVCFGPDPSHVNVCNRGALVLAMNDQSNVGM